MASDQIVTVITGVLEAGGIGTFVWFLIRGLRNRIASLKGTIDVQKLTIEAMERRLIETEQIGGIWKQFAEDIPEAVEHYKKVVTKLKDDMIAEQEKAIEQRDEQLREVTEVKLKQLELFDKAISDLPATAEKFQEALASLERRLEHAGILLPSEPVPYAGLLKHAFHPYCSDKIPEYVTGEMMHMFPDARAFRWAEALSRRKQRKQAAADDDSVIEF